MNKFSFSSCTSLAISLQHLSIMTVLKNNNRPIIYPTSDGKRMAENTVQFNWLVMIKQGLEKTTKNKNIFVAGDLLWYPVEGDNKTRLAPDVMVAIGRPKGNRGSYLQWKEDNIPPQIVIEILSPGNRRKEMEKKLAFYEKYGVKEYIIYYPQKNRLTIYERKANQLVPLPMTTQSWTSPLLGFRLEQDAETLSIFQPDGQAFISNLELEEQKEAAEVRAIVAEHKVELAEQKIEMAEQKVELAKQKAELAEQKVELAEQKAELAEQKAAKLAQKLKELGINPDHLI
jgi:Uma2 family endonuclease